MAAEATTQQATTQQIPVGLSKITNQVIALLCIGDASLMLFLGFLLVKGDGNMKLIALTAVIALANNVMGIAGTLLVGQVAWKMISSAATPTSPHTGAADSTAE
jgi:hypothetical protein